MQFIIFIKEHCQYHISKKIYIITFYNFNSIFKMSTGAVLQLAAYGTQDLYLTGNPQVTHFKSVIRRHTNFAIEAVENYFDGILAPGQKIQCKLQRVGDLVHQIYLKLDLPQLQSFNGVDNIYISWVNAIGYVIIDYIEIQIGERVIDKQYGQWMNIWSELITDVSKRDALNKMVGKHDFYTSTSQNGPLQLCIPLKFWFCNNIGSSLPLVAIQHQDVRINLYLKKFETLWTSNDIPNARKILADNIVFDNASLLIDYIFLDEDERRYFAQNRHFYLIEQIQITEQSIDITRDENIIELPFNHPVKEILWLIQGENVRQHKQWINYSGDVISCLHPSPEPPMINAILRFEGLERFEIRNEEYFRVTLPWKNHTSVPNSYIYTYSFAFEPEKLQPTGTANFSRIDRPTLHIKTSKNLGQSYIEVYAINYNIFRIIGGISGVLFAN